MNEILNGMPSFRGEHYECGQPHWFDRFYRVASVVLGTALVIVAAQSSQLSSLLVQMFFLLATICFLIALSPRSRTASISFVADSAGMYFPSRKMAQQFVPDSERRWLFVPWCNISAAQSQILMDESARQHVAAFSVIATETERREFLSGLTMSRHFLTPHSVSLNGAMLSFGSMFHDAEEVAGQLNRYRSIWQTAE